MDIAQRWFAIGEAAQEIKRLEAFHDHIVVAQWTKGGVETMQSQVRGQIIRLKRRAGLVGTSDGEFAEFFRNWVDIGMEHIDTIGQKRGHLRWILRMLRTPVIPTTSDV